MGKIGESFALILILIITVSSLSLLMVKPATAMSSDVNDTVVSPPSEDNIPTPTVPDFTVQVIDSNDFSVVITNQPFTPFSDNGGGPVQFSYSVRVGPLDAATDSNWTELYDALGGYPTQSNTQTTTITINLASGDSEYGEPNPVPVNSQFLVEVEAIIGFYGRDTAISPSAPYVIFGEASGWSNPQTVSLPSTGQTIPKPSVPEFTVKFVDASYNVAPKFFNKSIYRSECYH